MKLYLRYDIPVVAAKLNCLEQVDLQFLGHQGFENKIFVEWQFTRNNLGCFGQQGYSSPVLAISNAD